MSRNAMRRKPSPATVISLVALFVALMGTAYATVSKNQVKSKHVKNEALKAVDLKDNKAVGTEEVIDDSLTGNDINESSLTLAGSAAPSGPAGGDLTGTYPNPTIGNDKVNSAKVANNTLTADDLATDSVTASEILADAVASSEIAADVVDGPELADSHLHIGNNVNTTDTTALDGDWQQGASSTATCAAGETLLSGYLEFTTSGDEAATRELVLNPGAGTVVGNAINDNGSTETYRAVAVCL